jgi:hypothetical protein
VIVSKVKIHECAVILLKRAVAYSSSLRCVVACRGDNDGVLVDTEGLYFRATQAVLQTVGVHINGRQN